jgi:uncharacterized protein with PQ loop repeat
LLCTLRPGHACDFASGDTLDFAYSCHQVRFAVDDTPATPAIRSDAECVRAVVEVVFSAVAVTANVTFVWPQAVKLLRSRNVAGVSPGTWTISVVLFSVWAAFAFRTGFWALFAANASCLAAALLILAVGSWHGWKRRWAALSLTGVVLALLGGVFAPAALAVVMVGAGIALRVPQLTLLLRRADVAGVSALTWWLGAGTAASWLVVSTSRGAKPVMIANSTALASTLVLLAVLYVRTAQYRHLQNR